MRIVAFPENLWRIDVAEQELQVSLVRQFMGKERILKKLAVPDISSLPEAVGRTSNRVLLNLPRDQGVVRQLQFPVDVQHDLKSALTLQIEAVSAWPEQDVYWDYIVEKSEDQPKLLRVTIVVVPKTVVDPWLQSLKSAGLLIAGISLAGFDVNVLPPALRQGSAKVHVVTSYVLAASLVILGLVFLLREPYQQRVYASQIQTGISRLQPEMKMLVKQEAEWNALAKRYQTILRHVRFRDSNLDALKTLATVLPPETFLQSYRYQNESVTISGVSASALDVQSALEKSPVFQGVQFTAPITRDPSGKDRFTLTMSIEARQ
jgi:general secretion pathway protein L